VRRVTLAVIALSGLVGSAAAQHLGQVIELEAFRNLPPPMAGFWADNPIARAAANAQHEAQAQSLESMRASRAAILFGLTLVCSLTFVAALRMLRPAGTARESARRLLTACAIACAVLRTVDGAQMAAIATRAGAAWDKVMNGSDIPGGYPEGLEQSMLGFTTIGFTVVITAAFLAVASYFRSDSLRQLVEAADRSEQA
jgi:NADH:ubiquinone oxidoreductase subunit 5 (subunit L)/multisubunit Na+/H+ antiporter MnhA subunit